MAPHLALLQPVTNQGSGHSAPGLSFSSPKPISQTQFSTHTYEQRVEDKVKGEQRRGSLTWSVRRRRSGENCLEKQEDALLKGNVPCLKSINILVHLLHYISPKPP